MKKKKEVEIWDATEQIKMGMVYAKRREKLAAYMKQHAIRAVVIEDSEDSRDSNLRYFTGFANDGILILSDTAESALVAWDVNLASKTAYVDLILPYTNYERDSARAIKSVLVKFPPRQKQIVEFSPKTTYLKYLEYVDGLPYWDVRCRKDTSFEVIRKMRLVKDEYEIECIKEACKISDEIVSIIEKKLQKGQIKTEIDVALLIESECRKRGAERTGFDTLAAGPERSFAIHCFPNYTNAAWPAHGLSILDFGVCYKGYTSDLTLTVAKGKLSRKQEQLIKLVEKAYAKGLELYKKDVPIKQAAARIDEIFAKAKLSMPHGLGHGIGIDIHEEPFVRQRVDPEATFLPGMVVTLEPGLYDKTCGGVRLENDVLITEDSNVVLSHSKIIRLE